MYRSHFGLNQLPFKNSPDAHFFYEQASRVEILHALLYVIRRGDPIIKVTGEVGCGKTTLLRLLADSLEERFQIVYINSPNLSPKDLLFHIADELSIPLSLDLPKYALIKLLRERLLHLHASGKQVVMLVDEAQAMSVDTLEEIRLLSNIETNVDKLIQIVLFGQPELDLALQNPNLRQLKDRISYHIHVPPLTAEEVKSYLNYRMRQASYKGLDFFDTRFSRLIHKMSAGLPRSINTIADQLLMAAYGTGDDRLKKRHFKNISPENLLPDKRRSMAILITVLVFTFVTVFAIYRFENGVVHLFSEINESHDSIFLPSHGDAHEQAQSLPSEEAFPTKFDQIDENTHIINVTLNNEDSSVAKKDEDSREGSDRTKSTEFVNFIAILPSLESLDQNTIKDLFNRHKATEQWLNSAGSSRYLIQLSTSSIADYPKAMALYNRYKDLSGKLHIMLDLNGATNKYRVKYLYLQSSSYSFLMQELAALPDSIKKSQPFITPVKHLLKSLETTKQTLN